MIWKSKRVSLFIQCVELSARLVLVAAISRYFIIFFSKIKANTHINSKWYRERLSKMIISKSLVHRTCNLWNVLNVKTGECPAHVQTNQIKSHEKRTNLNKIYAKATTTKNTQRVKEAKRREKREESKEYYSKYNVPSHIRGNLTF